MNREKISETIRKILMVWRNDSAHNIFATQNMKT